MWKEPPVPPALELGGFLPAPQGVGLHLSMEVSHLLCGNKSIIRGGGGGGHQQGYECAPMVEGWSHLGVAMLEKALPITCWSWSSTGAHSCPESHREAPGAVET